MTREEAIEILENGGWWDLLVPITTIEGRNDEYKLHGAIDMAVSALTPPTQGQVEKIKQEPIEGRYDEWWCPSYACPECGYENVGKGNFCQNCGCLFTDKAVEMAVKRLEALYEEN